MDAKAATDTMTAVRSYCPTRSTVHCSCYRGAESLGICTAALQSQERWLPQRARTFASAPQPAAA
jgi:hypothetical protein